MTKEWQSLKEKKYRLIEKDIGQLKLELFNRPQLRKLQAGRIQDSLLSFLL